MISTTSHPLLTYSVAILAVLLFTIGNQKWNGWFAQLQADDDYAMVKKYLLTESPLEGYDGRPKLWVHTKFEKNSRRWQSFMSRSSDQLNQPYLFLTTRSLLHWCGDSFHVCLIDDESFAKLLPQWSGLDWTMVPEPEKATYRHLAMAELVLHYGGLVVPNSTVALQPLRPWFDRATEGDKVVVTLDKPNQPPLLFGAPRMHHPVMEAYVRALRHDKWTPARFWQQQQKQQRHDKPCDKLGDNDIVFCPGEMWGLKTCRGRPILLDHLMEDASLTLHGDCVGIVVPQEELLSRTRYQWYATLPIESLLQTSCALTKHIKVSLQQAEKKKECNVLQASSSF